MGIPAALSFTGGKDCTLALHEVTEQGYDVRLLVTFGPHNAGSRFKAHPLALVRAQAKALGIPHTEVTIQDPYLESYRTSISELAKAHGIEALVTGDILDVCERFMERAVEGTGVALIRPLWGRPRLELLQAMEDRGLDMVVTCVNVEKMDKAMGASLIGKRGRRALAKMREAADKTGVDAAGEHGEFHTAVLDGPLFQTHRVRLQRSGGQEEVSPPSQGQLGGAEPADSASIESLDGRFLFLDFDDVALEQKDGHANGH